MFSLGLATEPWTTNLQQSITGDFFVPTPVPQSVTLGPPVPKVVKGNGPSLQIRQLWEGTVTYVSTDHFVATLTDKTQLTNPDEQATFEFASFEVPEDDKSLVKPGSVFYLMIGTTKALSGQIRNISALEFRRLPSWTRSSLETASVRASSLKKWFDSEKKEHSSSAENR
jgi:hypothetical protein